MNSKGMGPSTWNTRFKRNIKRASWSLHLAQILSDSSRVPKTIEKTLVSHLRLVVGGRHHVSELGGQGEPLARSSPLTGSLSLGLLDLVSVNTVQEILPALGVLGVLNTDVNPLGQDLATNLGELLSMSMRSRSSSNSRKQKQSPHPLVDDHTDSPLGHVEDTAGLAMESLVGHTLLEGTATWRRKR